MKKFLNQKTIFGALILSIFANALWENVFKGFLGFLGKGLLTLSTLGIEKYKDGVYVDVASGFHEVASIAAYSAIVSIFLGFGVALLTRRGGQDEQKEESRLRRWAGKNQRIVRLGVTAYLFFFGGFILLSVSRISYVNKTIAYYSQLSSIAAPFLSAEQEELNASRFSRMKNKEDYVRLIEDVSSIILQNNQSLPPTPSFVL